MGASRGNDEQRWQKLLDSLDEKLQLGLLDRIRKVTAYHFEEDVLYLEPSSDDEYNYLERDAVLQHLTLLAQDAVQVSAIKLRKSELKS